MPSTRFWSKIHPSSFPCFAISEIRRLAGCARSPGSLPGTTGPRGEPLHSTRTARALRATFWTTFPVKSPQAHSFQTLLYHPCLRSMSHYRPWETSFNGGGRWSIFHEWGMDPGVLGMAV